MRKDQTKIKVKQLQLENASTSNKRLIFATYAAITVLAILNLISYLSSQLFFKELLVASTIIVGLLFLRIQDLKASK